MLADCGSDIVWTVWIIVPKAILGTFNLNLVYLLLDVLVAGIVPPYGRAM